MFLSKLFLVLLVLIWESESSSYFRVFPGDPFGLRLAYFEHVLSPPYTYVSYSVSSYCECRNLCRVDQKCLTVSVVKLTDGMLSCRISKQNIHDVYLTPSVQGVTFARNESEYFLGDDGSFYLMIEGGYEFVGAKYLCRTKASQGKVMMPKTKMQFEAVMAFRTSKNYVRDGHYFMVDLHWNTSVNAIVWGDGTLFTDSEVGQVQQPISQAFPLYVLTTSSGIQYFKGVDSFISYIICEINPLRP